MAREPDNTRARGFITRDPSGTASKAIRRVLTLITAAGLAVDAYVHWHLAASFDSLVGTSSPHISQGQLFRVEAVLALLAMMLVLANRRRFAALVALLVAAGGVGAVLLYGFVDVGGLGPLPDMYDPTWSTEKVISLIAEVLAALGALGLLVLPPVTSRAGEPSMDDGSPYPARPGLRSVRRS